MYNTYCRNHGSHNKELIEQVKNLLDVAAVNHMWGYLPTLKCGNQYFELYVNYYNKIHIKSDKSFRFDGMHKRSKFAGYPFSSIHLLPHFILAHIANELPKHISDMKDGVDTLYRASTPSTLNYSLHGGTTKVAKCSKHVGGCGEVILRFHSVIVALTHDIRMMLEHMSGSMSIFDTAEFGMYLDVAEIKVYFYAQNVDKAHIRKSGIEPVFRVEPKNITEVCLSASTLDEANKLMRVRNHLYEMTEFQLATMDINWTGK